MTRPSSRRPGSRHPDSRHPGRDRRHPIAWLTVAAALLSVALGLRWLGVGGDSSLDGRAHVIDGDSLRLAEAEIRLIGIDSPEGRQTCKRDGGDWPCGREARAFLDGLVRGHRVTCSWSMLDQHGRRLAECHVDGRSLNAEMVAAGWAVVSGHGPTAAYRTEEAAARAAKRGIWQGEFTPPREWRRQNGIGR